MIEKQISGIYNQFKNFKREKTKIIEQIEKVKKAYPNFNLGIQVSNEFNESLLRHSANIDLFGKEVSLKILHSRESLEILCDFNVSDFKELDVNTFNAGFLEIPYDLPDPYDGTATWEKYEEIRKNYVQEKITIEELNKKSNDLNINDLLSALKNSVLWHAEFFFKYNDLRCSYLAMISRAEKISSFIDLDMAENFAEVRPNLSSKFNETLEITEDAKKVIYATDKVMKRLATKELQPRNNCNAYDKRYLINRLISPKEFFDFTQEIVPELGSSEYCFANIEVQGDITSNEWELVNSKTPNKTLFADYKRISYSLERQGNLWYISKISFEPNQIGKGNIDELMQKLSDLSVEEE